MRQGGFLYRDILKGILKTKHSLQNILLSKFTPFIISFWDKTSLNSNLFKKSWGWLTDLVFLENKISCSCLLFRIDSIFHWYAQSFKSIKSLLSAETELSTQLTMENNEVYSAKSLTLDLSPCCKSLI